MTISDVREYEEKMQKETNERLLQEIKSDNSDAKTPPSGATTPTTPGGTKKGWFSWSWGTSCQTGSVIISWLPVNLEDHSNNTYHLIVMDWVHWNFYQFLKQILLIFQSGTCENTCTTAKLWKHHQID